MIHGMGIDIVNISRIAHLIDRYGELFLNKVFTPNEIAYCSRMATPAIHFAGRWATKEAFYKALPPESQEFSTWKSIEVVPEGAQRRGPKIVILASSLNQSLKERGVLSCLVSISHEKEMCIASVILV